MVGLSAHQEHIELTLRCQKDEPLAIEYCAPNAGKGDPVVSRWELYRPLRTPYTAQETPSGGPSIGYAPTLSRVLTAKTAAERAGKWLETCYQSHHACQEHWTAGRPVLPARVVKVAPESEIPKLYIPGRGETADYVTLSYCWGNGLTTTTTTSNLHERTQGIPWEQIPATLRDAILFAHHLGVSYLWIDALCILQDDPSDWMTESSKMADIYQKAILTLSATSSASVRSGIFMNATETTYDVEGSEICIRRAYRDTHEGIFEGITNVNTESFPGLRRGWTFQERALSSRIVHATMEELAWECCSSTQCECSFERCKRHISHYLSLRQVRLRTIDWRSGFSEASNNDLWLGLVEEYSGREFTKPSDRLVPFSGIAKLFQRKTELGPYFAGIWREFLALSLTWFVKSRGAKRISAPSWSWCSNHGLIRWHSGYNSHEGSPRFDLHDATMTPEGSDLMGPLTEGRIVLSCLTTLGLVSSVEIHNVWIRVADSLLVFRADVYQWADEPQERVAMPQDDRIELGDELLCAEIYGENGVRKGKKISKRGTAVWLVLKWHEIRTAWVRVGTLAFTDLSSHKTRSAHNSKYDLVRKVATQNHYGYTLNSLAEMGVLAERGVRREVVVV